MRYTAETVRAATNVWDDERSKLIKNVMWVDDEPPRYAVFGGVDHKLGTTIETVVCARKVNAFLEQNLIVVNPRGAFDAEMVASLSQTLGSPK